MRKLSWQKEERTKLWLVTLNLWTDSIYRQYGNLWPQYQARLWLLASSGEIFFQNPAKRFCLLKKKKRKKKCHRETRKREKGLGTAPRHQYTDKQK